MTARVTERPAIAERRRMRAASLHVEGGLGRRALFYGVLTVIALGTLVPFIAMALLAVTPPGALRLPSLIPTEFTLKYLRTALSAASIWQWSLNSVIYSVTTIVVSLFLASLAGYAFAKKKFAGRDALFWSFVAMLMVPGQLTIVPLFILIAELHGINTYWGLILPTLANAQAVFLLRQFIRDIPDDLIEASKIDGASEWYIYSRIILPLTKPVLATLGVFIFLGQWNDFFWPLLIAQSDDMRTLTVGLATLQQQHPTTGSIMAAATINFVPCFIVFAILQRYLVQGISMTGMK
jgi:multiple sugar transport system permease protein